MGLLINGTWADQWYDTEASEGEFNRQDSLFRHWITADGAVYFGHFKTNQQPLEDYDTLPDYVRARLSAA